MTLHWWYVTAAWGLAGLGFGAMLLLSLQRLAAAKRRLALLDPRAGGRDATARGLPAGDGLPRAKELQG
ncbi:hypothetical protein IBL26_05200 [Roseomonas aerophila]|uniref:Heme exporter protein D n=1 Tax=Teichococcus aerophilus TaxID=1224513 RepID=A0ABR7RIK8_9PROT|nr:hypothetical protein [Pseudoroseomonas aerophila]MBC9206223.1 hypothetical protein [Pseudoroseomonas aerophila]